MENNDTIIPPHLNAEIYRTDTTGTDTLSHLDYLRIHTDGTTLIGCSELTGRYWNGGASIFKSITEGQNEFKKAKTSISLTSGTADGCFVENSSKVLICEDNGSVSIWEESAGDAWKIWTQETSTAGHDNAVLAVDCLESGKLYVTAGADGYVKIWDINDLICVNSFVASDEAVCAVAVKPNCNKYCASASLNCELALWDTSLKYQAKIVPEYENFNKCGVRCCAWVDEFTLVYGDEAGHLFTVDLRSQVTERIAEFPAAIHKLEVQTETKKVAVCCDNKIISVWDISKQLAAKDIYHDRHMHNNLVRGLAWDVKDKNLLHTVGWDGEIKSHNISE